MNQRDRKEIIQEALQRISELSGVNLSEGNRARLEPNNRNPIEELRRRYPTLRTNNPLGPSSTSSLSTPDSGSGSSCQFRPRRSSTSGRSGGRRKKQATENQKVGKTIYKDLILIPDPKETKVPTHSARIELETEGKVVHGFPVDTQWDARTLRNKITDQFPRLIASPFEYIKVR